MTLPCRCRHRGSLSIAFALLLILIVVFVGMAVDLALVYARRLELQNVAQAGALAAATRLDGTMSGLAAAVTAAQDAVEANTYDFSTRFVFSPAALRFARAADAAEADWVGVAGVSASNVPRLRFVRFDTALLEPDPGRIDLPFLVGSTGASANATLAAVAGPTLSQLSTLAICALDSDHEQAARTNPLSSTPELVEFGFRRGVTYDLMDLNPVGTAGASFVINPLDFPALPNNAAHFDPSVLAPFTCTGLVPAAALDRLYVQAPYPLATLAGALNSRFGDYSSGACSAATAPPDHNVRQFLGNPSAIWITPNNPAGLAAQPAVFNGARMTVADLPTPPAATTSRDYGVLWAYAKAVQYSAAAPDHAGAAFRVADWPALYPNGSGGTAVRNNLTDSTALPYVRPSGPYYTAAPGTPSSGRRVLHVPLLRCPAGNPAEVVGIGKFMMTAKAGSTALYAEFGGLTPEAGLGYGFTVY